MKHSIETGFGSLDGMLGGIVSSGLIAVASRPSMGKTSFALNIVEHLATKKKVVCVVFSLLESREQIVRRMLCSCAKVNLSKFRAGSLSKSDWTKLRRAELLISEAPIYVDDSPALTIREIEAKAMSLRKEHGVGLVVIDDLQFIRDGDETRDRKGELSEITKSLKSFAKRLVVPVFVLCRLGRGPEWRNDKRPKLSDMRGLGSLERDADTVLFIYRDELYNRDSRDVDRAEIIIGKHKGGVTGKVKLAFRSDITRFENLADGNAAV